MDITKLAKKPNLTKLELDTSAIVANYGEAIVFYMYD